MGGSHQMSTTAKQVVDGTVNGEKTLSLSSRLEASHLAFSLASWLMRGFCTIVLPSVPVMRDTNSDSRH